MRQFLLTLSILTLTLASSAFPSPAVAATTSTVNESVTVGLTTAGYEFTPLIGVLIPPAGTTTTNATLPHQSFKATAVLENNTIAGIPCSLALTGTPGQKFEFTVYDAKGNVVWTSLPAVLPQLVELLTLPAGSAWRGSVYVPLFVNGKALPAGTYTLEASLFGTPEFAAKTSFVVLNPIAIN